MKVPGTFRGSDIRIFGLVQIGRQRAKRRGMLEQVTVRLVSPVAEGRPERASAEDDQRRNAKKRRWIPRKSAE
jgi:hypothetical protein